MLFSSIPFLYWFLPAVLIVYFLVPSKLKNCVLLLASLLFYAWGEPKYVLLMAVTIISGYVFGLLAEKYQEKALSKLFTVISAAVSIGFLVYFKYADFFIANFNKVTGLSVPLLKIALPVGISFYTFQILSYTIDVYKRRTSAQKNIINFAAYVSLFPQLIAGPIVRYTDIASQLQNRKHTLDKIYSGTVRFTVGLAKKVLIANALGELCDSFRSSDEKSVVFFWLYAVAFTLHIYFDFSGYSDMAIGLGRIFGFDFPENFNYPYISKSITEFWRRWHISLGSWFRDYVYIPLGGNRTSKPRWLFNIFVVWMLTGFWHGAAWNFVIWGLLFAVMLIIEKLWLGRLLQKAPSFFQHLYVLLVVILSFVIFNADNMEQAASDLAGMLGTGNYPFISTQAVYSLSSYGLIILLAVVGSTPLVRTVYQKITDNRTGAKIMIVLQPIAVVLLLVAVTAYLVDGSFNPFLYFRF